MKKNQLLINPQTIRQTAKLAELNLSESEVKKYSRQLGQVVEYINQLQQLPTDKTTPTSQVTGLENVFRSDNRTETEIDLTPPSSYFRTKRIKSQ